VRSLPTRRSSDLGYPVLPPGPPRRFGKRPANRTERMRRKNELTLSEAMDRLVDAYGLREKLDEQAVASLWDDLAGGMVARRTVAVKLRRGTLYIKVDSAPLRQELTYMREGLIKTINARLEREVVEKIVLD